MGGLKFTNRGGRFGVEVAVDVDVFPKIVKLYSDYKADPNLNLMITFFIVQFLISTLFVLIGIKSKKFTLKNRRNLYLIHILVTLALLTWLELTIQTVVIPVSRLVDLVR